MKKWFESRTIRVMGAIGIVGAALAAENLAGIDLGTGIELQTAAAAAVAGAIAVVLRFMTSTGVE